MECLEDELWKYIQEDAAPLISKLQSCSDDIMDEAYSATAVPVVTNMDEFAKEVLDCTADMNIYQVINYIATYMVMLW